MEFQIDRIMIQIDSDTFFRLLSNSYTSKMEVKTVKTLFYI